MTRPVEAVLFDVDGTLVKDVPYNGDPAAVRPMPVARRALDRLRACGLAIGAVTNQSGIARGYLSVEQVHAVHERVRELLGPFHTWQYCPHGPQDRCPCRKPAPGLVLAAARELHVEPDACVVVGDIGADVAAAQAAGASGVLVPTRRTLPAEIAAAPIVVDDLGQAVDWILTRSQTTARRRPVPPKAPPGRRVLCVRADSTGDVLLTGPALRAVADRAAELTVLCGPRGSAAAHLLPGVDQVIEWELPWVEPEAAELRPAHMDALVRRLRTEHFDEAIIFTSFHQSPLPMALVARLAGIERTCAISEDYPGALLDVRHRADDELPEPVRATGLAAAAGYPLPAGDDGRLRLRSPLPEVAHVTGQRPYLVVHPGASVPARACPPTKLAEVVTALGEAGWRVLVTGPPEEAALTAYVAGKHGVDLGGATSLPSLAAVLAGAECLIAGNTGPAHVAAAVGIPVVSLFAPTVPFHQWRPYAVPVVRLGDPDAPCAGTRARLCPVAGHPCLSNVEVADIVAAVRELTCAS